MIQVRQPGFAAKRDASPSVSAIMPETDRDLRLFLITAVAISSCWELLYRAYLLWLLEPSFGVIVAVLASALAYGSAHGWHGARAFAGSLVAALAFTVAYAFTRSLWWLMLVHAGLPVIAALLMRTFGPRTAGNVS